MTTRINAQRNAAMENRTTLSPDEARARFGELINPMMQTHRHFSGDGGDWRPVLGPGLKLVCYRFYPSRVPHVRPPYRPKPK